MNIAHSRPLLWVVVTIRPFRDFFSGLVRQPCFSDYEKSAKRLTWEFSFS
jgi:hypothetical protein